MISLYFGRWLETICGAEVVAHLAKVGALRDIGHCDVPSRKAMMDMISSPDYQACAVHRAAGLAGQLNIKRVEPMVAWLSP